MARIRVFGALYWGPPTTYSCKLPHRPWKKRRRMKWIPVVYGDENGLGFRINLLAKLIANGKES